MKKQQPKRLYFGQDPNVLMAFGSNIVSWFFHRYLPASYVQYYLLPKIEQELVVVVPTTDKEKKNTKK